MEEIPSHRADPRGMGRDSFDVYFCVPPIHSSSLGIKCQIWLSNSPFFSQSGLSQALSHLCRSCPRMFCRHRHLTDQTPQKLAVSLGASVCCAPRVLSPLLRERVTLWLGNSASPTSHGLCGWLWLHPLLGSAVVRILRPPTVAVSHSHSSQSSGKTRQTETKRLRGQKTYKSFSCHHSHLSVPLSYHTVNSTHLIAQAI
jgi:hypothetical protein